MGLTFSLDHANIVAHLTVPFDLPAPRLTQDTMQNFLSTLKDPMLRKIVSSRSSWPTALAKAAEIAESKVVNLTRQEKFAYAIKNENENPFLDGDLVKECFFELRKLMSDFSLFGLSLDASGEGVDFAYKAAIDSKEHGLFLIPEKFEVDSIQILDPFPGMIELSKNPSSWPGMLLWSRRGYAAFIHQRHLKSVFEEIMNSFRNGLGRVEEILWQYKSSVRDPRILHLSLS